MIVLILPLFLLISCSDIKEDNYLPTKYPDKPTMRSAEEAMTGEF